MLAPIGIFAYNRPNNIKKLLSSLMACPEFSASPVRVFIDGPKNPRDAELIQEVNSVFKKVDHPNLLVNLQSQNRGLRVSLSSGITALCEEFGSAIVLEDDLEVAKQALTFFNSALDRYSNNDRVWSICIDVPQLEGTGAPEAKFLPFANSWGWATWSRAWRHYESKPDLTFNQTKSQAFRERFSVHGLRDYPKALERANAGLTDSWFIYWQLAHIRHNALSVYPPWPLVRNNGLSGGTHASGYNLMRMSPASKKALGNFSFSLPESPCIDFEFLDAYVSSREWKILRLNSILGGLRRRLYRQKNSARFSV